MTHLIYSYALLKALVDESQDYIDAFWPLVIRVIPRDKRVKMSLIQKKLHRSYKLTIPLHVLKIILGRAKIKEFILITRNNNDLEEYSLTLKGNNYLDTQETTQEVRREINLLLKSIKDFYKDNGLEVVEDEIEFMLEKFIEKNIDILIGFFRESDDPNDSKALNLKPEGTNVIKCDESKNEDTDEKEILLIKYISNGNNYKTKNDYDTLRNLVLGSLIYTILSSEQSVNFLDLNPYKSEECKINECSMYFDTNYVFSLLDLDYPNFNKSSQELFELVRRFGCKTYVFSFTVDEICRVIKAYQIVSVKYPFKIKPGTIFSSLRTKGWTTTDADLFITNIRQKLENQGILVHDIDKINLNNYVPEDMKLKDYLYESDKIKERTEFSLSHDIAAIENIIKIRGRDVRKIEEAKALFVTSDNSLNEINFIKMGHKDKGTIPEVMLDRVLTNILWLKNPKIDISLELIIAAHSKELFVQKNIWDRFYDIVIKAKNKEGKEVKDEDFLALLVNRELNESTNDFSEEEIDRINSGLIQHLDPDIMERIETIEDKKKKIEFEEKLEAELNEIRKKNEYNIKALEEYEAKQEKELAKKTQELSTKEQELQTTKNNFQNILPAIIEQHATEKANLIVGFSKIAFFMTFAVPSILLWNIFSELLKFIPIVMLLIAILGIRFEKLIWDKIATHFKNKYKQNRTDIPQMFSKK
jgi:hypothetical protein